jgi:hypothetical protein
MKHLVFLFFGFVWVVSTDAGESEKPPVEYWSEVLSANNFDDVLSVFQAGPKVEWPTIHSAKYTDEENKNLMAQEAEFRKLGERLAHKLEDYERQLQNIPLEQFCERSGSLLVMRQHLLRHPSYFNLILVDSINRVLYVNLVERLAHAKNVPPCLLVLAENIGKFHPNLQHFLTLAEEELGKNILEKEGYSSASDAERLTLLWSAIEPEATLMFPKNVLDIGTYQLIKKQDMPLLLNRVTFSDLYIHSLLPALILYRQEADVYSPLDSYQQIKDVLGQEERVKESLGSQAFDVSRAASAVNHLLQDIQSGKTRKLLFFSDTGIYGADSP